MNTIPKWEVEKVEDVHLPTESFGWCIRARCKGQGWLADGLCQKCWDRTAKRTGNPKHNVHATSIDYPSDEEMRDMLISKPNQILIANKLKGG